MTLKKEVLKNTFWVYLFSYLAAPIGYFIRMLYANNLSVEDYGLVYSIIGFYSLISIFNDLGMTETLKYYGVKFYEKKKFNELKSTFYYTLLTQFFIAGILSIIIYFTADFLSANYFHSSEATNTLRIFSLYFIFFNLLRPISSFFLAKMNFFWERFQFFMYPTLILIISGFFVITGKAPLNEFFALSWALSYIILTILFVIILKLRFKELKQGKILFEKKLYKKIISYSLLIMIGTGATFLLGRIDIQMITYLMDLTNVAHYEVSMSVSRIISALFAPIATMMFPVTTKLLNNNKKELNQMINIIYKVFIFLILPAVLSFSIFPREIITILFGNEYFSNSIVFILLTGVAAIMTFVGINFSIIAGLGKIKERNKIFYVAAGINLLLNYILIKAWGINGASLATLIVGIYMLISSLLVLKKNSLRLNLNMKYLFKLIILNAIFLGSLFILKLIIALPIIIEVFLVFGISIGIYLLLGYYFKIYRIKEIINSAGFNLPKKLEWVKKF